MKVKQAIDSIGEGERVEIAATDAGFSRERRPGVILRGIY